MAYFLEKGIDVDSADQAGRTALHHATHTGNELFIVYAAAFGANINAKDNEGCTPLLHVCKNFDDNKNIDCLKKLLLAGADKEIVDDQGFKAINWLNRHIMDGHGDKYLYEAKKIMSEKWSVMQFLAIKGKYGKQERSTFIVWSFYILMILAFIWMEFSVIEVLR